MAEHAANFPVRERRVALKKRRRVAEMSPQEMRRELLTSEVTGLPNRRAFDEAGAASAVAMSDVDGLKALNRYGYQAGNAVLRAKAEALKRITTRAMSTCVVATMSKTYWLGSNGREQFFGIERSSWSRLMDVP
jgi:GGDEF domain-containing protein